MMPQATRDAIFLFCFALFSICSAALIGLFLSIVCYSRKIARQEDPEITVQIKRRYFCEDCCRLRSDMISKKVLERHEQEVEELVAAIKEVIYSGRFNPGFEGEKHENMFPVLEHFIEKQNL